MGRWPAQMRMPTAAEYLDMSVSQFKVRVAENVPSLQMYDRGDRYWMKEDLDAFLEQRRRTPVRSQRAS